MALLEKQCPDFIHLSECPASSPGLNPMDYRIWEISEQKTFDGAPSFATLEALEKKLVDTWSALDQNMIKHCGSKNGYFGEIANCG
ncbi:MAG: hypothetical protein GY820_25755 [Gammaproteobacteria bacterium]|nr:hypothetical protein [Gammaproteobacteria bacterium]